VQTVQQQ